MHPLEKKTLKILTQEELLKGGEKVLAAVSGGPDSMALLHVLARLAPVLDITVAAAHVNHGLRPGEAEEDAALAIAEAGRLGLDFFLADVDVKDLAERRKLSLEHAARLLRYNFIEKTARRWGATKIALGHTADDQAEELLLRLVRGTARKGLSGMKTMRQGCFIRPFLRFPKSELLAYLDRYGIPFQHDSSNEQDTFLRNRVRNNLLPYLAERYNPEPGGEVQPGHPPDPGPDGNHPPGRGSAAGGADRSRLRRGCHPYSREGFAATGKRFSAGCGTDRVDGAQPRPFPRTAAGNPAKNPGKVLLGHGL
jgi:tRNA(Ile)-lysidine synthetase-like protein